MKKGLSQLKAQGYRAYFPSGAVGNVRRRLYRETDGGEYEGTALLIASGAKSKAAVAEFESYLGRRASYCAVCDGFFFRGKDVGVIGAGEYALSGARELMRMCKSVCISTDGAAPEPISGFRYTAEKSALLRKRKYKLSFRAAKKELSSRAFFRRGRCGRG